MAKIRAAVEREGSKILLVVRLERRSATLSLPAPAAGTLDALLARALASDEDSDASCYLDGDLDTTEGATTP